MGALRLFRVAGITVYLHYLWFLAAIFFFQRYAQRYHAPIWGILEYLSLFFIVLLHEFGHAFACRQVGGQADRIVLWPLGGIAFVNPPQRPAAQLWSIVAGPLVNALLVPVFSLGLLVAGWEQWRMTDPDLYNFVWAIWFINIGLLVFNLLPVYPLDGGQIVRSLLWFVIGPIRSMKVASIIGFVGAIGFGIVALRAWDMWLGILAFFVFSQAQAGWRYAQMMAMEAQSPPPPPVPAAEPPPLPGDPR